jgi:hypothetical protein
MVIESTPVNEGVVSSLLMFYVYEANCWFTSGITNLTTNIINKLLRSFTNRVSEANVRKCKVSKTSPNVYELEGMHLSLYLSV